MNKMNDPKYQVKIIRKIKAIEDAIGDLTENEISAVVCAAVTAVLVEKKDLSPLAIKYFYAEMAVNAIDKTDVSAMVYKMRFEDDTN